MIEVKPRQYCEAYTPFVVMMEQCISQYLANEEENCLSCSRREGSLLKDDLLRGLSTTSPMM